jgi:S-adenosylmethionine synthetase
MDNMVKNQKDTGHTFLFTSESVGEGHPGKNLRFIVDNKIK